MGDADREKLSLVVPGTVDFLDTIRAFIDNNAREAGFSAEDVDAIVLSMDEAVANIVEHAYEGSDLPADEQVIHIDVRRRPDNLSICLRDRGAPFDPTDFPGVDLDAHLGAYKMDGLGIYFIRELMDEIHYRYIPETGNELELVKNLR